MSIEQLPPLDVREAKKRRRERWAIVILTVLFTALTIAEFRLSKVSSSLPFVNSIFFFGLLNFNIIVLVALLWLIFRNIGKVFLERRRKILGSRLKSKLVAAFISFTIIPTLVLFVISSLYINSSFDKWFSIKIQNTLQASLEITHSFYKNADQTAMHFADHISQGLSKRLAHVEFSALYGPSGSVRDFLEAQRELLALDAVEFYWDPLDDRVLVQKALGESGGMSFPRLANDVLDQAFAGENVSRVQHLGMGDLIRCAVPVQVGAGEGSIRGVLVVNSYIPVSLVNKVGEIASVIDDYKDTNPLRYPIKTVYFLILIMITLVIIFVGIWMGLYMARELTVPVERLVQAAQEVGAGNLDVNIAPIGHDEIAVLVHSFNKMTLDLRENRKKLTLASTALEQRRQQLETVLTNVGTGVIAVDYEGGITTCNRASLELLRAPSEQVAGRPQREVFTHAWSALAEAIDRVLKAGDQSEALQLSIPFEEQQQKILSVLVSPLGSGTGAVVTMDDLTLVVKGQREMAWREVARRIAHEIKNPLTPIKLSAQRLQRRLGSYGGKEAQLLQECTDTIIKNTDELRDLVNEFSNFARFPEVNPTPNDLNEALGEVVKLFRQAHPGIIIEWEPEVNIPVFDFDRDQIKRVMINLFDNSVAALYSNEKATLRKIRAETHYHQRLQIAVVQVKDNGPGMTHEVMERVFEPYFSTKSEGTGLGLAIAKRIINDHDGFIRVHSQIGVGTEFLIELPTSPRGLRLR